MSNPFDVFGGKVKGVIRGKKHGDFRFENSGSLDLCFRAAEEIGIGGGRLIFPKTATGDDVAAYTHIGVYGKTPIASVDSLRWVTEETCDGFLAAANGKIGIGFMPADCPIVVLFAEKRKESFLAVLHCGWRGVAGGIINKAVGMMRGLGIKRTDIAALATTGIGPCCYEVTEDVRDVFVRKFGHAGFVKLRESESGAKVWSLNLLRVIGNEIDDSNIGKFTVMTGCTKCNSENFWSHRRGDKERNLVVAALS